MGGQHAAVPQLARQQLGVTHIVFFTVAASAPLTVLGGGVTTTFAVTGVAGSRSGSCSSPQHSGCSQWATQP